MSSKDFDQTKSEQFAETMVDILNNASLALMTSIGHQTGLFDTMADLPPSTHEQIAMAAGLNERYVREWLGTMVVGRIVDYDPALATYSLPLEHAAWLTRRVGRFNLAQAMQMLPLFAAIEEEIIACFREGGGVPYSAYTRFQAVMAESSGASHDELLIDTILPLVPGLIERLHAGIDVADVGCGCGHTINLMADAFPASQFVGYDFSEEGIETARLEAAELGLSNARFELKDVLQLDAIQEFDLITAFDAIHDQVHPALVLKAIANALRLEGTFLMVDVAASSKLEENLGLEMGPFLYTVSTMHCMAVSLAHDGEGLGALWGEQKALEMLAEAGFTRVEVKRLQTASLHNYYIATKQ